MSSALRTIADGSRMKTFDIICAGEGGLEMETQAVSAPTFRPGGGAVKAAIALARQGLRVGLATVLADDTFGRGLREEIAHTNVDAAGIALSKPSSGLFLVRGGARQVVSFREEEQAVEIPLGWSSQVLLLSGMSPVVSHGAALCKAARAARRAGSIVVVDVNARWQLWEGRDPRSIRMILREADVVWCSAEDLFGLNLDIAAMRSAMRANAVLAMSDGLGKTWAMGPFGELVRRFEARSSSLSMHRDDAFVTAICAELARAGQAGPMNGDLWTRALDRGHLNAAGRS